MNNLKLETGQPGETPRLNIPLFLADQADKLMGIALGI